MRSTLRSFIRQLVPSVLAIAMFTLLVGVAYPLVVTGVSQLAFRSASNGSLITRDKTKIGSSLIGQPFVSPQYFRPRPSAAGTGYDPSASSGSNLGPSNADLLDAIDKRVKDYRTLNGLSANTAVPVDAVTASGSGLDPDITQANARLQAQRVAEVRGIEVEQVLAAIDDSTTVPLLGIVGERTVNVLHLNLLLDERFGSVG